MKSTEEEVSSVAVLLGFASLFALACLLRLLLCIFRLTLDLIEI